MHRSHKLTQVSGMNLLEGIFKSPPFDVIKVRALCKLHGADNIRCKAPNTRIATSSN